MKCSDNNTAGFWKSLERNLQNRETLLVWVLVIISLLYIPVKIIGYGWVPLDDALRHSAHGVNEKSWQDVLIIRSEDNFDHNSGWHSFLRFLHRHLDFSKEDLLLFSILITFFAVQIAGLYASPKPMAWVVALLLAGIAYPSNIFRLMLGRPFLITAATTLVLLKLWSNVEGEKIWSRKLLFSVITIVLAVWMHGSWYLLLLIPFSFFLAGQHHASTGILLSIILGTVIASIMTGAPFDFFRFHFTVPLRIFSEDLLNRQLASEFQSLQFSFAPIGICALIVIALLKKCRFNLSDLTTDPVFMLMVTGFLLGIKTGRFWIDWGWIAMTLWLALKVSDLIKSSNSLCNPRVRYCLTVFFCVALVFTYTHDAKGRFSDTSFYTPVQFEDDPKLHGWEPGDDGIVYSDWMLAFYAYYYAYPHAKWKYVTGFEPVIMSEENLAVFRDIDYNRGRSSSFELWVKKMRPQDRIITSRALKNYEELEWVKASLHFMVGRLKRAEKETEGQTNEKSQ